MKRILLAFALVFVFCMSSLAQKTYVTVTFNRDTRGAVLSGDVPTTLKRQYKVKDIPKEEGGSNSYSSSIANWMGYIINLLAKEGFTVDQLVLRDRSEFVCILSKSLPEDKNEEKKE